ncbi:hypothetical protein OROMI_010310 [Orobanche minor]
MAAYAALVSVMHIIDNLRLHPRPPISLHKEQAYLLTQKVAFLQQFLQLYNPNLPYSQEADPLETRIARAAYAAEDAIESHILGHFTNNDGEKMSSDGLYKALEKVIEDMALIEKEALAIKETLEFKHAKSMPPDSSRSYSSSMEHKKSKMVGVDDLLFELKDKLASNRPDLQTIQIVGMGGSGKTTLALNIYRDGLIMDHFYIRAWVTISQEYNIRKILEQLHIQLIREPNPHLSQSELEEILYKHLCGRRYMIILDDIWSIKACDEIKWLLPDNKNGSRIVITTRLTTLASTLPNSIRLAMKLLDDDDSWDLLSKIVFGEKGCCPPGFEDIGKKIGKSCKGLPLSIVVVGGLLAKSEQLIEFWENMEKNLNAIVNLEDDERCLKTLYISYKQLPVHLKPCFLYMGIYREDHVISISKLIKLWVAEGFAKPVGEKRQEDVAREYVKDLSDRNLILIHKLGSIGSIKHCKVHDLLRDLCLREAKKEGFYTVYPGHLIGDRVSRTVMSGTTVSEIEKIDTLSSKPLARYLILDLDDQKLSPLNLRLGIVHSFLATEKLVENMHQLVNSRLLNLTPRYRGLKLSPSLLLFWNLHTLNVHATSREGITVPTEIWYMSHIRHLYFTNLHLPDPPPNVEADGVVLANLQTLGQIINFTCSEQVVKIIPNIRKLEIFYDEGGVDERFCLTNLDCLDKLESLICNFRQLKCLTNYPLSLKKLSLAVDSSRPWEDILDKIGDLPLLEKLTLYYGRFKEVEWETTEGQFSSLKSLSLCLCEGLQVWTSEPSHFPRLEQLYLKGIRDLEEIPLDFAEISTLRLIDMNNCSDSCIGSAKSILEEQEALYGEEETTLQIRVALLHGNDPALKSLRSPNFHVT